MRTKTLLLTAVLGAAGVVSSMAQVYSVNAVGYVNLDLPSNGYSLIANPLNNGGNKLSDVLMGVPDGTTVYTWTGAGFDTDPPQYIEGAGWLDSVGDAGARVLSPGAGFFLYIPPGGAASVKVTFVGEVPQGDLSHAVSANYSIQASEVPQSGLLTTDLKFTAVDGDTVYQWVPGSQTYNSDPPQYIEGAGWLNSVGEAEPTIGVGEGFFVFRSGSAGTWSRTFSVNN